MSIIIPETMASPEKPSLVICDDHLVVAEGLARALGGAYKITSILTSGHELERLVLAFAPSVVVTEVNLRGQSGLDALERTRARGIEAPFVICTSLSDTVTLHRALQAGARGVVTKAEGVAALQSAIELALGGKVYLSDAFVQVLASEQRLPLIHLTPRQQSILELIDEGMSAKQIAYTLGLSRRTVESHKLRLLRMTDTHSPQALLVQARRLGLLRPPGLRRLLKA
jgi:DNA-binding NarL/FixJ family response regulator